MQSGHNEIKSQIQKQIQRRIYDEFHSFFSPEQLYFITRFFYLYPSYLEGFIHLANTLKLSSTSAAHIYSMFEIQSKAFLSNPRQNKAPLTRPILSKAPISKSIISISPKEKIHYALSQYFDTQQLMAFTVALNAWPDRATTFVDNMRYLLRKGFCEKTLYRLFTKYGPQFFLETNPNLLYKQTSLYQKLLTGTLRDKQIFLHANFSLTQCYEEQANMAGLVGAELSFARINDKNCQIMIFFNDEDESVKLELVIHLKLRNLWRFVSDSDRILLDPHSPTNDAALLDHRLADFFGKQFIDELLMPVVDKGKEDALLKEVFSLDLPQVGSKRKITQSQDKEPTFEENKKAKVGDAYPKSPITFFALPTSSPTEAPANVKKSAYIRL